MPEIELETQPGKTGHQLPEHIPSLDGLRAVSVLLVIAGHASMYGPDTPRWRLFSLLFLNAEIGVAWFFVISGFLITILLMREYDRSGRVSLKNFYIRRAFRILPPFYALVLFVLALKYGAGLAIPGQRIWSAATFTYNIIKHPAWGGWWLGHTWSLSVEEQFYLCWPFLFISLTIKQARWAAILLIVLAPIFRLTLLMMHPEFANQISGLLPSRMDALMLGALAALCYETPTFHRWIAKISGRLLLILAGFVFLISPLLVYRFGSVYLFSLGYTLQCLCLLLILIHSVDQPTSRLGRILNTKNLCFIGILSYDIYLWQQLFMTPQNKTFTGLPGINLIFIGLFALASYRFVERPSRMMSKKLLRRS